MLQVNLYLQKEIKLEGGATSNCCRIFMKLFEFDYKQLRVSTSANRLTVPRKRFHQLLKAYASDAFLVNSPCTAPFPFQPIAVEIAESQNRWRWRSADFSTLALCSAFRPAHLVDQTSNYMTFTLR